jgi:hypothetical protein
MTRGHYRAVTALFTLLDRLGIRNADEAQAYADEIRGYARSMV